MTRITPDGRPAREISEGHQPERAAPGAAALLFGVMAPAVSWGLSLFVEYGLVNVSCAVGHQWMFRMVTLFFALVCVAAGWVAHSAWRDIRGGRRAEDGVGGRAEWMALSGLMSSALFLIIVVAQGAPPFFFYPCQVES